MTQHKTNYFEKHPILTLSLLIFLFLGAIYVLFSIKWIKGESPLFERKSLKSLVHQYYVGKIIDNNVGRFIKLREHRPNEVFFDRPSRRYLRHVEKNSIERKYYRIKTDSYGFIEPSDIHKNPEFKILFLGGSTTECRYIDEKKRFPYLVGRMLESNLKKTINSYNGGVSANESMHSLNILLNKGLALKPNIVVLMHNVNDLDVLRSQGTYWYQGSLKSHIQTSKNLFTQYEFPLHQSLIEEQQIVDEFCFNLETFIAICQIRKVTPVLMTQANRVGDYPLYHRFNQLIREVGQKHQILVIDLAKAIPSSPDYLYDSYHLNRQGSILAANVIAKALMHSGIF